MKNKKIIIDFPLHFNGIDVRKIGNSIEIDVRGDIIRMDVEDLLVLGTYINMLKFNKVI